MMVDFTSYDYSGHGYTMSPSNPGHPWQCSCCGRIWVWWLPDCPVCSNRPILDSSLSHSMVTKRSENDEL